MQEERGSNSCDYSGCDLVSREFIWSFSLCLKIGYSLSFCNSAGSEFQSFVPKYVMLFLNFSLFGFLLVINFFLLVENQTTRNSKLWSDMVTVGMEFY